MVNADRGFTAARSRNPADSPSSCQAGPDLSIDGPPPPKTIEPVHTLEHSELSMFVKRVNGAYRAAIKGLHKHGRDSAPFQQSLFVSKVRA